MRLSDLTNVFGIPSSTNPISEEATLLVYSFPLRTDYEGAALGGFTVRIVRGLVEEWSPVVRTSERQYPGHVADLGGTTRELQLVVVSEQHLDLLGELTTNGMAAVPHDLVTNAVVVTGKVFSGRLGGQPASDVTVILVLDEESAERWNALVARAAGKRMLVMSNAKAISTQPIAATTRSRQLTFTARKSVADAYLSDQ